MRFSTLSTLLASSSLSSAIITGFTAPSTLAPGSSFTFNLTTANAQQRVADVAVAWGFTLRTDANPTGFPYFLGSFADSAYLGPSRSNVLNGVVVNGTVPEELNSPAWIGKDVVFSVAVFSLTGVSGGLVTQGFNATVKIQGVDSVVSGGRGWIENGECQQN
jgi:hypothetical protein